MSLLKRFTLSVSSRIDRLVGDIENHDAVVEVGIRDSRRLLAQAQARYQRLSRDGEALQQRLDDLHAAQHRWRERALSCAPTTTGASEDKALQCLKRARQAARQAAALQQHMQQHQAVQRRLAAEIDSLRERVAQLEQRRTLMRCRETTARTAVQRQQLDQHSQLDLDDTFERWEMRLTEAEMAADSTCGAGSGVGLGVAPEIDPLEEEFLAAEERNALQAELQTLRDAQPQQATGAYPGVAQ
ncbi:PspA/IM30 family protein [Rhabdochromatium marinum]|uniref:PspA/IM30 family protein n=1 Tax=Rhabdochromatium marinum TaxID=48729 RepID=UPI0019032F8B|nr:PspA/IM30 family protein [Rhabdochromatium marinum]MBK1649648.1 hypothetical protein [Rhabdochromatium marinum]